MRTHVHDKFWIERATISKRILLRKAFVQVESAVLSLGDQLWICTKETERAAHSFSVFASALRRRGARPPN